MYGFVESILSRDAVTVDNFLLPCSKYCDDKLLPTLWPQLAASNHTWHYKLE